MSLKYSNRAANGQISVRSVVMIVDTQEVEYLPADEKKMILPQSCRS